MATDIDFANLDIDSLYLTDTQRNQLLEELRLANKMAAQGRTEQAEKYFADAEKVINDGVNDVNKFIEQFFTPYAKYQQEIDNIQNQIATLNNQVKTNTDTKNQLILQAQRLGEGSQELKAIEKKIKKLDTANKNLAGDISTKQKTIGRREFAASQNLRYLGDRLARYNATIPEEMRNPDTAPEILQQLQASAEENGTDLVTEVGNFTNLIGGVPRITPEEADAVQTTFDETYAANVKAKEDAAALREENIKTAIDDLNSWSERNSISIDPSVLRGYAELAVDRGLDEATDRLTVNARNQWMEPTGPDDLTYSQAYRIAQEMALNAGLNINTEADDPLMQLARQIQNQGVDATIQYVQDAGGNFGYVGENYIDPALAEEFARGMIESSGKYNLNTLGTWTNSVLRNGFEGALEAFQEAGNEVGQLSPVQGFIERNNEVIKNLSTAKQENFDSVIESVLAGERITLPYSGLLGQYEAMDPESAVNQMFDAYNMSKSSDAYKKIMDYANDYGVDMALEYFQRTQDPTKVKGDVGLLQTEPVPSTPETLDLAPVETPVGSTSAYNIPTRAPIAPTTIPTPTAAPTGIAGIPQTAYPTATTYTPAPYTPPPLRAATPTAPALSPAQQFVGAPEVYRPVGAPMQALTPEQLGSQFVPPTQEDYYAFFGYTPEQLNAEQYLAELEGAPRAGIAAQTVPVLPPAVTGAPAPTGMKEGGMPQDAQKLAAQGRGEDTMLIHMSPQEIAGLQSLAQQMGASLTINPQTGLPEADIFNKIGKTIKKYAPEIGAIAMTAAGMPVGYSALLAGGAHAVGSGSLEQGIARGLSAFGAANLASAGYTAATGNTMPGFQMPVEGGSSMGAGVELMPGDVPGYDLPAGTAGRPMLDRALDVLGGPATVPTTATSTYLKGALPFTMGLSMQEGVEQRDAYDDYMRQVAELNEDERKRNKALFDRTLGAVPVKSGGLIALAGGGMTYAEGGGTTGATNEPRMVKGTGDGMSDSVPATIEGVQEARLANDEFVVPADVVADIGNGSSSAGAQQLYDMMDRVRQARHGTTEQPPEIDVRKLMPA